MCRHHPLLCILPPIILKNIIEKSESKKISDAAYRTLALSAQIRGTREAIGMMAHGTAVPTGEKRRTIYDAKNGEELPGKRVRGEGDPPSKDVAVNEAYEGAGATYDLFKNEFQRNSIDAKGLRLDSTVHYSRSYDNAFWDGRQMVYGDGDKTFFNRFTIAIDVIGHELAHGVTQYEASLEYHDQPGALNESFSDVFGSLVKQRALKQDADEADWLIGAGLLAKGVKGVALRSMSQPGTAYNDPNLGKDPQPGHMKKYSKTSDDNGGVHINSGIPNRAFYLTAMAIGGAAWKKAGKIWYIALRDRLRERATFKDAAALTSDVAAQLYGLKSKEALAVHEAWRMVGVISGKVSKKEKGIADRDIAALRPSAGAGRVASYDARSTGRRSATVTAEGGRDGKRVIKAQAARKPAGRRVR